MQLKWFHVRDYQSIRDSGRVTISEITCLVGKNEAGKSALLEALYKLNPVVPTDGNFDVTIDYPRMDVEDFLQAMSAILQEDKRTGLDPRWTITPVGGSSKVPTFVVLLGSQKDMTIATLIDSQSADQQKIEGLYRENLWTGSSSCPLPTTVYPSMNPQIFKQCGIVSTYCRDISPSRLLAFDFLLGVTTGLRSEFFEAIMRAERFSWIELTCLR